MVMTTTTTTTMMMMMMTSGRQKRSSLSLRKNICFKLNKAMTTSLIIAIVVLCCLTRNSMMAVGLCFNGPALTSTTTSTLPSTTTQRQRRFHRTNGPFSLTRLYDSSVDVQEEQKFESSSFGIPKEDAIITESSSDSTTTTLQTSTRRSYISSIRCKNLAGIKGERDEYGNEEIFFRLDPPSLSTSSSSTTKTKTFPEGTFKDDEDIEGEPSLSSSGTTNLVVVTGETGSGKSLLVSKVADLVTGGKVSPTMLVQQTNDDDNGTTDQKQILPEATVEMALTLDTKVHKVWLTKMFEKLNLKFDHFFDDSADDNQDDMIDVDDDKPWILTLKRSLTLSKPVGGRVKSICYINNQKVTLNILKQIGQSFIAIVNAPIAASALTRTVSRVSMLDVGVPDIILQYVYQLQMKYKSCRNKRIQLEKELSNHILPISMTRTKSNNGNINDNDELDDKDLELLRHWIQELDGFESRITTVCQSLLSKSSSNGGGGGGIDIESSTIGLLMQELNDLSWMDSSSTDDSNNDNNKGFSSLYYKRLLDLSNLLKSMDNRIEAAKMAYETLASLTLPTSAKTALDRTRELLIDASEETDTEIDIHNSHHNSHKSNNDDDDDDSNNKLFRASERAHELLNYVEDALMECAAYLDDDNDNDDSLLRILTNERYACHLSSDDIMEYIFEWNTLARKHGVSPYVLPSCHASLRKELDGNVEARVLLPNAKREEAEALRALEEGNTMLSNARRQLATNLSKQITKRLPQLGMETSRFVVRIESLDGPIHSDMLGSDKVDFLLLQKTDNDDDDADDGLVDENQDTIPTSNRKKNNKTTKSSSSSSTRGGKIESVASSGEKARILLAIECELPTSIRSLCNGGISGSGNSVPLSSSLKFTDTGRDEQNSIMNHIDEDNGYDIDNDMDITDNTNAGTGTLDIIPPVAVIYDEIDAHVGGRASVSVAQMLSDQSKSCQIISITHSPSVAAIGDVHVCITKQVTTAAATATKTDRTMTHDDDNDGNDGDNDDTTRTTTTNDNNSIKVIAKVIDGIDRQKELARMASGNIIEEEAGKFAQALLTHAANQKRIMNKQDQNQQQEQQQQEEADHPVSP